MKNHEKQGFIKILMACGEIFNREVKDAQIEVFWQSVRSFPFDDVKAAFNIHMKTSKFFPTPADIIEKIPKPMYSGHLGADEAWHIALKAMDENVSVITNEEILKAREIAMDIYESGDKVGARMAFRDAYNRVITENPVPNWFLSLGRSREEREGVILKALEHGVISRKTAQGYLPGVDLPESKTSLKLVG